MIFLQKTKYNKNLKRQCDSCIFKEICADFYYFFNERGHCKYYRKKKKGEQ